MRHKTAAASAGAALTALLIAGCGNSFDTAKVQDDIKSNLGKKGVQNVQLSCPNDVKAKAGSTFECSIKGGDSNAPVTGKVSVTLNDEKGEHYKYDAHYTGAPGTTGESQLDGTR